MEALRLKYKNVSLGKQMISQYLSTVDINTQFQNDDLALLISNHPNHEKSACDYFIIRNNIYKQRELHIKPLNGAEASISYITCMKSLFGKKLPTETSNHRYHILQAMRNAISNTKRLQFHNENGTESQCCICNKNGKCQIDHHGLCFQEIVDDFVISNKLVYSKLKYEIKTDWYATLQDKVLEFNWITYHDNIANYRLLCKNCNCTIGTSGYKSRT